MIEEINFTGIKIEPIEVDAVIEGTESQDKGLEDLVASDGLDAFDSRPGKLRIAKNRRRQQAHEERRIAEEQKKQNDMTAHEIQYIKGEAPMTQEIFVNALKKYGMWDDIHIRTKGFIDNNVSELTKEGGYSFFGRNPSTKLPAIIKELRQKLTEAHLVSN